MINAIGLGKDPQMVQVKVLDYDTIFQVKEKILDALCKTTPYSLRPPKDELDLGRFSSPVYSVIYWSHGQKKGNQQKL